MTNPFPTEIAATPAPTSKAETILDQYAARAAREAVLRPANKTALFDALVTAAITRVIVTFDGCGDSGQIEEVTAYAGEAPAALPATEIEIASARWDDPEPERRMLPVAAAIEALSYDLLGEVVSGWENNDGAYGEFVFDVEGRTITLDFNGRYTTSDFTQFEF